MSSCCQILDLTLSSIFNEQNNEKITKRKFRLSSDQWFNLLSWVISSIIASSLNTRHNCRCFIPPRYCHSFPVSQNTNVQDLMTIKTRTPSSSDQPSMSWLASLTIPRLLPPDKAGIKRQNLSKTSSLIWTGAGGKLRLRSSTDNICWEKNNKCKELIHSRLWSDWVCIRITLCCYARGSLNCRCKISLEHAEENLAQC